MKIDRIFYELDPVFNFTVIKHAAGKIENVLKPILSTG
jgi:hypothetical protein